MSLWRYGGVWFGCIQTVLGLTEAKSCVCSGCLGGCGVHTGLRELSLDALL